MNDTNYRRHTWLQEKITLVGEPFTIIVILLFLGLVLHTLAPSAKIKPETVEVQQNYQIKQAHVSAEEVQQEIIRQSALYNIDTDTALRIAKCESNFIYNAQNQNSTAVGVYQFLLGTADYIGLKDRYDYRENIRAFMVWYPKYPNWWQCS